MSFDPSVASRPRPISRSRRRLARLARRGLAVATLLATFGPAAQAGVIADWIANRTAPQGMNDLDSDGRTNKSLISRWLSGERTPFSSSGSMGDSSVYLGQKGWEKTKSAPDPVSEADYSAAKKLFDKGDYKGAEKLLAPLAKREVKKGGPWGEKAQYWLAEVQFRQQKYVAANDNYELLIKHYPGTDYRDQLVAREYQIAQLWLSGEDSKTKPMDWKSHFDGRQPLIDSNGYAVKTLDHVRLHDPQGPLADDAALRMADHYHIVGDYEAAALYYDQLIAEHPKSEFREKAMRSSIDAKIKGYIGPEYDITGLEQARDTIQKANQEFPDHLETAKGLYHTLDLIRDQEAERAYSTGLYYVRARKPISAEYQFGLVMAKWPNSKWAGEAKKEIAKVAKMPRKASMPSKIMTAPGAPDPSTMGGMGGNNGQAGGAMSGLMNGMGGGGMGGGGMGGMGGPS